MLPSFKIYILHTTINVSLYDPCRRCATRRRYPQHPAAYTRLPLPTSFSYPKAQVKYTSPHLFFYTVHCFYNEFLLQTRIIDGFCLFLSLYQNWQTTINVIYDERFFWYLILHFALDYAVFPHDTSCLTVMTTEHNIVFIIFFLLEFFNTTQ
jgi:hypothetical protein